MCKQIYLIDKNAKHAVKFEGPETGNHDLCGVQESATIGTKVSQAWRGIQDLILNSIRETVRTEVMSLELGRRHLMAMVMEAER